MEMKENYVALMVLRCAKRIQAHGYITYTIEYNIFGVRPWKHREKGQKNKNKLIWFSQVVERAGMSPSVFGTLRCVNRQARTRSIADRPSICFHTESESPEEQKLPRNKRLVCFANSAREFEPVPNMLFQLWLDIVAPPSSALTSKSARK